MAEEAFKLPGSSYAEVARIIRAYGHANDDAVPKDVADRAGIDPTIVSRNNGFLLSVGILSGGRKKTLTPNGRALSQAIDHDMQEEVASAWRTLISESEFFKKILSAVRIRGGMDESSLRSHVAYTAGSTKNAASMAGAGSCIEVLVSAGFLKESDDGRLVAASPHQESRSQPANTASAGPEQRTAGTFLIATHTRESPSVFRTISSGSPMWPTAGTKASPAQVSVQVHVRVDCKPNELEGLAPRLKALMRELNESESDKESSPELKE